MKRLFIFAAALCFAATAFAQEQKTVPEAPKSKLENFSEKAGSMLKKEFFDLALVKGVSFQVLKLTDLGNNSAEAGLRISARLGSTSLFSNYVAFLDKDELAGFQKAIDFMISDVITLAIPENDVEYRFMSRSGFTATVYNGTGTWSTKKRWNLNLQLEKYMSGSNAFLSAEDLPKIKAALELAKAKLDSL